MLYLIDLEAVDTRYTKQWKEHLPKQLRNHGIETTVVTGGEVPQATTPGAFLNFAGTNNYKSQQMLEISRMFAEGKIKDGDYFLYTDAWNPTVIQLKYMAELLNIKIRVGGMWHAGSYDSQDFLGRLIGDVPWVRNAESSMFYCYNDNFFATRFHVNMFLKNLFDVEVMFGDDEFDEWAESLYPNNPNIKIVGWPMEYIADILKSYATTPKKNKIIFPHRLAPEKQLNIFKDLAANMPEYEFFVAQEHSLSKHEYHQHLAESKIVFSANLQETLGISVYEGALVGAYPLMPDRLSYSEIWPDNALYPSNWSKDFDSYLKHKVELIDLIHRIMKSNNTHIPTAAIKAATEVGNKFFSGKALYNAIVDSTA